MTFSRLSMAGIIACFSCLQQSSPASGQCQRWEGGPLSVQNEGVYGIVECYTMYTPPGEIPLLILGGSFNTYGVNLTGWDGASFRYVGSGFDDFNGPVWALTVYNGDLIAAGDFTAIGNVACNRIASFDGHTWHPLGSGFQPTAQVQFPGCYSLTIYNGELIAGGTFQTAGGLTVNNIARWNGSNWSGLSTPSGTGVNGPVVDYVTVRALTVMNNILYVGGDFTTAASIPVQRIAQWNGSSWSSLGGVGAGVNNYVQEFGQSGGTLIVAGEFTMAGPSGGQFSAASVARWNPGTASWSAMGAGIPGTAVYALQNFNGGIVAGGWSYAGGFNLAFWNGTSWSQFGGGVNGPDTPYSHKVTTLGVFNNNLFAGGWFNQVGGSLAANNIAQYAISTGWSKFWTPPAKIYAMTTLGSRVVAGGDFTQSTTTSFPAHDIIAWDGINNTRIETVIGGGEGSNGTILALYGYTVGGPSGGTFLLAGGSFSFIGGVFANNIAVYTESLFLVPAWSTLGSGSGFDGPVRSIDRFSNVIYVGGDFIQASGTTVNRIARLNGSTWTALGTGMNGPVYAVKGYNGMLYAGGAFTTAGGVSTGGLARWNGSTWSNVGGFFLGTVYTLDVNASDNTLAIGGLYPGINSSPNLARYNGVSGAYSTFGVGGTNGAVRAIRAVGNSTYVGGSFTTAGGIAASNIARFNPSTGWNGLPNGANSSVQAFTVKNNDVQVGGEFTFANGITFASAGWAQYLDTGIPWIARQPVSDTEDCGSAATFYVEPPAHYWDCTFQWFKNNVPLSDGPTGNGSEYWGTDSFLITVFDLRVADAGSYSCRLTNACGEVTSNQATLTVANCCSGDANHSGTVNIDDLVVVITNWGTSGGLGDVTGNGIVDIDDLVMLISHWGACP